MLFLSLKISVFILLDLMLAEALANFYKPLKCFCTNLQTRGTLFSRYHILKAYLYREGNDITFLVITLRPSEWLHPFKAKVFANICFIPNNI